MYLKKYIRLLTKSCVSGYRPTKKRGRISQEKNVLSMEIHGSENELQRYCSR